MFMFRIISISERAGMRLTKETADLKSITDFGYDF
jgi:hypothetical protein